MDKVDKILRKWLLEEQRKIKNKCIELINIKEKQIRKERIASIQEELIPMLNELKREILAIPLKNANDDISSTKENLTWDDLDWGDVEWVETSKGKIYNPKFQKSTKNAPHNPNLGLKNDAHNDNGSKGRTDEGLGLGDAVNHVQQNEVPQETIHNKIEKEINKQWKK